MVLECPQMSSINSMIAWWLNLANGVGSPPLEKKKVILKAITSSLATAGSVNLRSAHEAHISEVWILLQIYFLHVISGRQHASARLRMVCCVCCFLSSRYTTPMGLLGLKNLGDVSTPDQIRHPCSPSCNCQEISITKISSWCMELVWESSSQPAKKIQIRCIAQIDPSGRVLTYLDG